MSEHTPEPVDYGEPWVAYDKMEPRATDIEISMDDYARARACVNACKGIATEVLEQKDTVGMAYLALYQERNEARARAEKAEAALKEAERERDQAILHDRQPYPTAAAYEAVCAARTKWQERAEKAEALLADVAKAWHHTIGVSSPAWMHELNAKIQEALAGKGE